MQSTTYRALRARSTTPLHYPLNRDDATSSDATVRDEYVRKNGDLFREILRMFNAKSEAGKTLMLQTQDEFDNDHDGHGLWEYLKAYGRAA